MSVVPPDDHNENISPTDAQGDAVPSDTSDTLSTGGSSSSDPSPVAASSRAIGIPILQRSRRDWIACGTIAAVSLIGVLGVIISAPINDSTLTVNNANYVEPPEIPLVASEYSETWRAPADTITPAPIVLNGLVISTQESDGKTTISALDASNGSAVWSYTRDVPLCSLSEAWNTVVADYRTGMGCGDVVSINADSGTYNATRSALASTDVVPVRSNDRVGIVSKERVELWRSDMVRTVEYGDVSAKSEPEQQPHEECEISSALTRTELLAVVEACPNGKDTYEYVRLQKATPEESRKPEVTSEILLSGRGNQIVAIGESAVAIYSPSSSSIISYNDKGEINGEYPVNEAPLVQENKGVFGAQVADLPHNMSWFDGKHLYLFMPSTLEVTHKFDDAIGTGVSLSGSLVYPTQTGLNVANWDTGEIIRSVAIDRNGYSGPVSLGATGSAIVEKRGNEVVGLLPAGTPTG